MSVWKRALASVALVGLMLRADPASAEEDDDTGPRPALAVFAGAATSLVAAAAGSLVMSHAGDRDVRNAAFLGMNGGIALAPFVAHAVTGELWRGVAFSAVPALSTVALGECFAFSPTYLRKTSSAMQWVTSGLLSLTILSSGIGVVDAAWSGERKAARARRAAGLRLSPVIDPTFGGAMLAGSL